MRSVFILLAAELSHLTAPPFCTTLQAYMISLLVLFIPTAPPHAIVFSNVSISASSLYCFWIVKNYCAPSSSRSIQIGSYDRRSWGREEEKFERRFNQGD